MISQCLFPSHCLTLFFISNLFSHGFFCNYAFFLFSYLPLCRLTCPGVDVFYQKKVALQQGLTVCKRPKFGLSHWLRDNLNEVHQTNFWMHLESAVDFAFTISMNAFYNGMISMHLQLCACKSLIHRGDAESLMITGAPKNFETISYLYQYETSGKWLKWCVPTFHFFKTTPNWLTFFFVFYYVFAVQDSKVFRSITFCTP